jgi:hypothetical protein
MAPTTPDEDDASTIAVGEELSESRPHADYRPLLTKSRNGLTLVRLSIQSSTVTTALVDELR